MITSKQRSYLRSLSNTIEPVVQIGKDRLDEMVLKQIDNVLEARELIKLSVLKNCLMDAREFCNIICEKLSAEPVQVIGNRFIIYRKSSKNPKIELD